MTLVPRPDVALCVLEEGGLVFSEAHQTIYRLNPGAVLVWCKLWDEGLDLPSACRSIADLSGCSLAQASAIVHECLEHWSELGLIAPSGAGHEAPPPPSSRADPSGDLRPHPTYDEDCVLCAGIPVLIRYPDAEVADSTRAVLAHLPQGRPSGELLTIDVEPAPDGYRTSVSGRDAGVVQDAAAVAANVKLLITESLLERDPDTFALHGAALLSPAGAVLLAGASGSGKTTLASVLHAGGWPVIADDIVLVDENRPAIRGLAFAMAAKPGSWGILRDLFPGLESLRAQTRPDGRVVRYIPPLATADRPQGYPVRAILFVTYEASGGSRTAPVSKADAMAALLKEAKNHRERLTLRGFRTLAAIVREAECLELRFTDSRAAAHLIQAGLDD